MQNQIDNAKSVGDIFGIVKRVVKDAIGKEQAGILVAMADLGAYPGQFIGAYYDLGANTIVINKRPLMTMPKHFWNEYLFHILLHEYIHSCGFMDELQCRNVTAKIIESFGLDVPTTIEPYGKFVMPGEPKSSRIDYVPGIDRKNTDYIM